MKCPVDGVTLKVAERQGVEIDYCPDCRGVWLDRGELDKIIDRAATEYAPSRDIDRERDEEPRRGHGGDREDESRGRKKRRGGFLGDLFEFGD